MVSADNLHFDVLGLIFAHLSGNDLVSVSLVSRSFLQGVLPRLYQRLFFTPSHAKKYEKVISPFATVLSHPYLAVYVHTFDITALPLYKGQPNHEFLIDCVKALNICHNLSRFNLSSNVFPTFLRSLLQKEKLRELTLNGSLTSDQAELLIRVHGIRSLHIDHGSWCLMNAFPRWAHKLNPTLTHLSLRNTSELNEAILERVLILLPELRSLHILSCMRIDHKIIFRLVKHTPLLENLSLTAWEQPSATPAAYSDLPYLRRLTLDSRNSLMPTAVHTLWSSILASTSRAHAPLESLTLKVSEKVVVQSSIIQELLDAHADTLTSLRFSNCNVGMESLAKICDRCNKLETLRLPVPMKNLNSFAIALRESRSLHTIIDEREKHPTNEIRATLTHDDVKMLMAAASKLRTIESDNRRWKGTGSSSLCISLERLRLSSSIQMLEFS